MTAEARDLAVDLSLAAPRPGRVDISHRANARSPLKPGGELPFDDRTVASVALGDAVGEFSERDQIQLLLECRRVLVPGGRVDLVEAGAPALHRRLERWAALAGLHEAVEVSGGVDASQSTANGWSKPAAASDSTPLVSIVIPSSNPRFFLECLDSALAQTYPNIEIVICDDSEADVIAGVVAARAHRVPVRFERNLPRLRTRRNYYKCLSLAQGELIKFLNDDDVLDPHCVERMAKAFVAIPDLALATSHRWRIDAASQVIEDMPATRPIVINDLLIDGVTLANAAIMHGLNFIGEPSTAMFRKRDFGLRGWDGELPWNFNGEDVPGAIDFAMWARLLVQGNAVFFHERLSKFRIHGEQAQAKGDVVARSVDGIRRLQQQWIRLGLFRLFPPQLMRVQPYRHGLPQGDDWFLEPVRSLPPLRAAPIELIRAWRATRHPFDNS